jgi:hypothetical protein
MAENKRPTMISRERSSWAPVSRQHQLTSGLFVLAALFVRAAVALAFTILATLLAALLAAGRFVVLLISARRLLAATLLILVAALLSEILIPIVCHIYSSPFR